MNSLRPVAVALACAALVGCAHAPPVPALLVVSRTDCASTADLRLAQAIAFDGKDDASVSAGFDANTPCLDAHEKKSLYRLYRLPDSAAPYIVSITSTPVDGHLFAPRVALLDASGAMVREIPADAQTFRDGNLSLLFRGRKGEAYLVIGSDPDLIGKSDHRIQEAVQANTYGAGTVYVTVYSGSDTSTDLVYSHNGSISVTLSAIPAAR